MDELLFEVADGIGRVTFNRPAARNALTWAMYDGLVAACTRANQDPAIRAVLLTGAGGKAFAAGTDIGQFRAFATTADALAYEARIDAVADAVERCRVPTIAVIEGACTGGGFALAACCDLRIAADTARFGFPIARTLGNCLSKANLSRLAALLGAGRAKELIFTARLMDAAEALQAGLVSEVVAPDMLAARADALARTVIELAPLTLRATKMQIRQLRADVAEDEDAIAMCYGSADFREGMDAFLTKRRPVWQGR